MRAFLRAALLLALSGACGKSQMTIGKTQILSTAEVFDGLSPSCSSCHQAGASAPFFSSLAAFENLVVYNERYIRLGAPDNSEFLRLLQGTGSGANRQMPLGGDPYSVRAQRGEGRVSMAQLRLWITHLTPRQGPPLTASEDAPLVRRKSAEQLVAALKAQLGLTDADIFPPPGGYGNPPYEIYPARTPDAIPAIEEQSESNYVTLGGANWLKNKKPNPEPNTVFALQFVPMSQAWCRLAVAKSPTPVLVDASLADSNATPDGNARIKRNIARLHLRMLGELPSDADVSELLGVFQVYESNGSDAAWIAVCSALIRHPLWISF